MIGILAGCFPNCTPAPGTGFSMAGGSSYALGAAVILFAVLVVLLLISGRKGGK